MFENDVEVSAAPVYKHQDGEEEDEDDGGSQFGGEIKKNKLVLVLCEICI